MMSASLAQAAPVNLGVNGGFESLILVTPDPGKVNNNLYASMPGASGNKSWDVFGALEGWTPGAGDAGIEVQTRQTVGLTPAGGDYYVELDSDRGARSGLTNSSMSQTLSLGAGSYKFSFDYSPRTADLANSGIAFSISDLVNDLVVGSISGSLVSTPPGSLSPSPIAVGTWSTIAVLFNVMSPGAYTLKFAAIGADNKLGGFIDNVHVSAVPLPAPAMPLIGGLAALGLLRRKRVA